MKRLGALTVVFALALAGATIFIAVGLFAQTDDNVKLLRATDPAVAPLLAALSHPTRAAVEVDEITVPWGEYTHCETETRGTRSSSDCAPQTRFEHGHRLVLSLTVDGQPVKVIGGCYSFEHDPHCESIVLGGVGRAECGDKADSAGKVTHNVCTEKGWGTFVIEKRKKRYFIYPVEGKPNHRYYIPLATINDMAVSPD